MSREHFKELREWSERKHELVRAYVEGFTKILGSSQADVYYVDGFAGRGTYDDGSKGSPLLIAEYACTLVEKPYRLHCINVEIDQVLFANLEESTQPYRNFTTNYPGAFADHVSKILGQIGTRPAIFFLDPCGVKGMEWDGIHPILTRSHVTEVLLRLDSPYLARLAGFIDSDSRDSQGKCQLLTSIYGFPDCALWERAWHTEGEEGLVKLYMERLVTAISQPYRGASYVCRYPIRTVQGRLKYYLVFATRHPKGLVLMSDVVYQRERSYERDVEEYKEDLLQRQRAVQTSMLDVWYPDPTKEQVISMLVQKLKEDIVRAFAGKRALQADIRRTMILNGWFGRAGGPHFTQAFKEMEQEGKIIERTGARSNESTCFVFGTS